MSTISVGVEEMVFTLLQKLDPEKEFEEDVNLEWLFR